MKRLRVLAAAAVLGTSLVACAPVEVPPTPTPTPTPTATPASTDTPTPTSTLAPSDTPTVTSSPPATATPALAEESEGAFLLPLPEGEPVGTWNGVPIMPGALQGEERDGDSYVFTIEASMQEITDYYLLVLPDAGWEPLAIGEGETGNTLIICTTDTGAASVSIFMVDEAQSLYFVMLLASQS